MVAVFSVEVFFNWMCVLLFGCNAVAHLDYSTVYKKLVYALGNQKNPCESLYCSICFIAVFGAEPAKCLEYACIPGGSDCKESACNAGDLGLIPGLGRSPGEGNGNTLQYSCLENSMDRGAWWATVHGVRRIRHDWATHFHFTFHACIYSGYVSLIGYVTDKYFLSFWVIFLLFW